MKRLLLLIVMAGLLLPMVCFGAADDAVECQVRGAGSTRALAIKEALVNAVSKVRGVVISSEDYVLNYEHTSKDVLWTGSGTRAGLDALSMRTGGTVQKAGIEGLVKSYEVLDEIKLGANEYEVSLKVWVFEHQPIDAGDRVRLAMIPPISKFKSYSFGTHKMSAAEMSLMLSHQIGTRLTQSNKFAILDREYIAAFAKEKKFTLSEAPLAEQARVGLAMGADYLLVGVISEAGLKVEETINEAIGYPTREFQADFEFDWKLVAASTRQVKFADTASIDLRTDEVKSLSDDWGRKEIQLRGTYKKVMEKIVDMIADQVVEKAVEELYPIRIASVNDDGTVIISQGGKRIVEGAVYEVFSQGKEIIDPDTKESLGNVEVLVATIKIERVNSVISYGKIIGGFAAKVEEGAICRKKEVVTKAEEPAGRKSKVKTSPSGGVRLPFD